MKPFLSEVAELKQRSQDTVTMKTVLDAGHRAQDSVLVKIDIADVRISETDLWHISPTLIGQIQNLSNRRSAF